jgi:glycosyltransferase involved in cell wall biosynthesis
MIRVLHCITGLSTGGAETMLLKLLSCQDQTATRSEVVSLTSIGPVGERIQELTVPVSALGMRQGWPEPWALLRLAHLIRVRRPDIVHTWLYHANLLGGLAARLAGHRRVIWGIRQGRALETDKWSTRLTLGACARLSARLPTVTVCCSQDARQVHRELGFAEKRLIVIPNGFDLDLLKPDSRARQAVRERLGLADDTVVIGLVARFDPYKDHHSFVRAAAILHAHHPAVQFVLCGDGVSWQNRRLAEEIDAAGIRDCCHLLGRRDDIPAILAALDVATSSSVSEGFPNAVGEAMACGVPCVVTDAGDSALIVGKTGAVVPPRDPAALANAWQELVAAGPTARSSLGVAARQRISDCFSLSAVAARYGALYRRVLSDNPFDEPAAQSAEPLSC